MTSLGAASQNRPWLCPFISKKLQIDAHCPADGENLGTVNLTGDLDKQFGDPPPCFSLGSCVVSKNLPVLVTIVFEAERVQPKILSAVSNSMDLTTIMSYTHKFFFVS